MDDDDDEPQYIECRLCGRFEASWHETCPYAGSRAMSETDEAALLALLKAESLNTWQAIEARFDVHEFVLGSYRIAVFFDGWDARDWDYLEWAEVNGERFHSWPQKANSRCHIRWLCGRPNGGGHRLSNRLGSYSASVSAFV